MLDRETSKYKHNSNKTTDIKVIYPVNNYSTTRPNKSHYTSPYTLHYRNTPTTEQQFWWGMSTFTLQASLPLRLFTSQLKQIGLFIKNTLWRTNYICDRAENRTHKIWLLFQTFFTHNFLFHNHMAVKLLKIFQSL